MAQVYIKPSEIMMADAKLRKLIIGLVISRPSWGGLPTRSTAFCRTSR
jgi:hypothetical protein